VCNEILILSGRTLSKIKDQTITRLIEEYKEYSGDGYCELEGEILVCVASIPWFHGKMLSEFLLVRMIFAVDPRVNRVYLYLEGGKIINVDEIVGKGDLQMLVRRFRSC